MELDDIDRRIISVLQLDATKSIQEVGDEVGLTSNPCWRRIRRLEEAGIIVGRVAVIDAAAIGLGMTAFVQIHTDRHTKDWLKAHKHLCRQIERHRSLALQASPSQTVEPPRLMLCGPTTATREHPLQE